MSQTSYSIIECLRKKDNHIRGISKYLGINQMSVLRKLKELEERNIVDYREEGKNKVYFIKESIEAKEFLFILEHEKLIETIEKYPRLRNIVKIIKEKKDIKLSVLFGSYAEKKATFDSDIDLFIETDDPQIKKELELLDSKLSLKTGNLENFSELGQEIIKKHVIFKGFEIFYDKIHKKTYQGK
ncbi:MAG: nucleotidyltransferase domain-containing protein [Candidatus Woesearchaeota archaeon]